MERLSGVDGIVLPKIQSGVEPNYAYFAVYFDHHILGFSRDDVYGALREHDIYSREYFYPAVNELDCYKEMNIHATPIAHDVSLNILTLPIYEGLAWDDVDRICDVILSLK